MAGQANDSEKLPWLEPYREPVARPKRTKPTKPAKLESVEPAVVAPPKSSTPNAETPRKGVPLAAWLSAGIAVVALAAGGGYWAGHRTTPDASAPTVTIPVAKVDPIPMPEVEASAPADTPSASPSRRHVERRASVARRASPARTARAAPPAPPKAAPPMPKVMSIRFSPPPSAGRPGTVVDLGRYLSPSLADSAYRSTVGRYPYLSRLSKVVAPQPVVYGQPRLFALQLGARGPLEARQLCTNLKKIGRPCVVR